MNLAKATDPSEATDSIVISFDSRWFEPITTGKVKAVFRRRGPTKMVPKFIYVYTNSPICALIARMNVTHYEWVSDPNAELCEKALLSVKEAAIYADTSPQLAVYHVGLLTIANPQLPLSLLNERLGFKPPQSFFHLSSQGKIMIDKLAAFPDPEF